MKDKFNQQESDYLFTCKDRCGSHDLYVEHYYTIWQGTQWSTCVERGSLNIDNTDEHRTEEWEDPEKIDSGHEDDADAENAGEDNGNEETEEAEIDEDSSKFYVRCEGCNREIEFGWSHPDRGGRIWPAECTDFNPWKCWPEPRYIDTWKKKGWLGPSNGK
ncbi:MAG: hypothetical protein A2V66_07995 [Ignavibacteria bacterium RBG_13_36_8]|nr:MAG: hypothetical protein A2V66_07995 [Ignavibacteria bacterium RBG_13_36_8]